MANHYEIPSWAGKPAVGLHLDVTKEAEGGRKLIQKLMIDQKRCYLFGRNPQMTDFCIDHASCSRVHAALVWHKHLNRAFIVDLGSTHGTYIGTLRIEGNKPTQLPIDSTFHFGASTRYYTIRERPQTATRPILEELEEEAKTENQVGGLLGLPETETELDNLTEFNTAHNRRISMLGISDDDAAGARTGPRKRKKQIITFNEDEEVINPEDIDPTVGRFRNLIHSTVIPTKRIKSESIAPGTLSSRPDLHLPGMAPPGDLGLYGGLPPEMAADAAAAPTASTLFSSSLASKLGLPLMPNPAPDVDLTPPMAPPPPPPQFETASAAAAAVPTPSSADAYATEPLMPPGELGPRKKKYAKEAWPGKKPAPSLLV